MTTSKEDLILAEVRHLRTQQDNMAMDVAVLKAKHDTGNLSEKAAVFVAILALLISTFTIVTSCKEKSSEAHNRNGHIDYKQFRGIKPGTEARKP